MQQYSVPSHAIHGVAPAPIGNPTYFDLPESDATYSHLTPVNVPGGVPEYFVPASNGVPKRGEYVEYNSPNAYRSDGYLSVDPAQPAAATVPAIQNIPSYENVDHASVRRKRETAA